MNFSPILCLDCNDVRVVSGDVYDQRFKVEFGLHHAILEEEGTFYLSPNQAEGEFILDLGCEDSFDTVELVNTHNSVSRDRSTQKFQVSLR